MKHKKYIWDTQIMVDNLKNIGQYILLILIFAAMCISPVAWV